MTDTMLNYMLATLSYSALYLFLFLILLFIVGFIVLKIIYHIYLNIYILLYSLTINKWVTIQLLQTNYTVNISNNMFCSTSFLNTEPHIPHIPYFDITILSEQCNIIAPCVSNKTMIQINNTFSSNVHDFVYGKSFLFSDCMYVQLITDMHEYLIFIVIVLLILSLIIYALYSCCIAVVNKNNLIDAKS
jgi:hypothetical protein